MASLVHSFILLTEGTRIGDVTFSVLARVGGGKVALERSLTTTLFYLRHPELLQQFLTEWAATQLLGNPSADVERHLHAMHCHRTGRLRTRRNLLACPPKTEGLGDIGGTSASRSLLRVSERCTSSSSSLTSESDPFVDTEATFEDTADFQEFSRAEAQKFMRSLPADFEELLYGNLAGSPSLARSPPTTSSSTPVWRSSDHGQIDLAAVKGSRSTRRKEAEEECSASPEGDRTSSNLSGLTKVEFFEQQLKILSDLLVDVQQIEEMQKDEGSRKLQDERPVANGET
ncbi:hypothetical protein CSUI_010994 [Cystoisospora suis]|uniref:Uncharacterized protein n=1 Tax=Cystoisospora suis TaxID=483139 RepID=A0A2C6KFE4_9APIC|nr:hypothetical protein CSUI_010994 [Cystoisospora suis]